MSVTYTHAHQLYYTLAKQSMNQCRTLVLYNNTSNCINQYTCKKKLSQQSSYTTITHHSKYKPYNNQLQHNLTKYNTYYNSLHTTCYVQHGSKPDPNAADITVTFVDGDNISHTVTGKAGTTLLELAHDNDIELEGKRLYIYIYIHLIILYCTDTTFIYSCEYCRCM